MARAKEKEVYIVIIEDISLNEFETKQEVMDFINEIDDDDDVNVYKGKKMSLTKKWELV